MTDPVADALKDMDSRDVAAIRGGDGAAFRRVYDRYGGAVLALSFSILGDWARAEDASQEAFVKVHNSLETFQPGTNLRSWILTIAHHTAVDATRRNRKEGQIPENAASPPRDLDSRRNFEDMLGGLAPDERLVVTLKYREDLQYKDIAQVTGKAEGTLRNLVSAALKKLRGRSWS